MTQEGRKNSWVDTSGIREKAQICEQKDEYLLYVQKTVFVYCL